MNCPYCGKENPEDVELCEFCGGSLIQPSEQPPSEAQLPEPPMEVIQAPEKTAEEKFTPVQTTKPPTGGIYGNKIWWIIGCLISICLILACVAIGWGVYRFIQSSGFFTPATATQSFSTTQVNIVTSEPTIAPVMTVIPQVTSPLSTQITSGLLFFDDFSDPTSGWDQVEETDYSTNYYQGMYRIFINSSMSDSWANPSHQSFSDVTIEVDATKNAGPDDNDFGVICRYLDTNRFYYAVISSDGYFGITKVTSTESQLLGLDNLVYSDVINQGYATNRIRFDCFGSVLTLYVNGEQLDQQTDSEYSSGNIGLIAGTYSTPGTDILFDNFEVYSP